jgi:hypothetical protein
MAVLQSVGGFFSSINRKLTGGVTVKITPTDRKLCLDGGVVTGTVELSSKVTQVLPELKVKLEENFKVGNTDSTGTNLTMGEAVIETNIELTAGQIRTFEFELPYHYAKTANDELKSKGGVLGAAGRVGKFLDGEKSRFELTAHADAKGAWIGAVAIVFMKME